MKKYWPYILIIILIVALVFTNIKSRSDYADQIDTKNDSIEVLNDQIQIIQIYFKRSQELFVGSENDILLYQDSLDAYRATIYRNRENYEATIADIIFIPTDTMYRKVTEWLDNR